MHRDLTSFAHSRGFQPEELERFGIRFVDSDHVVVPVLGRSGEWYERTRCDAGCHPKYESPKGAQPHLYNPLGLGPHSREVWFAEGEFDAISLVVAGATAVGVLGAQAFHPWWALLFEGAEIVIAFDADETGRSAAEKLAYALDPQDTGRVTRFDPSPYLDLNEWLKEDREGFIEAVQGW